MLPYHTQLLPSGHLVLTEDEGLPKALVRAFSLSTADGLLVLATEAFEDAFTADLAFWRMLAHDFFQ